MSAPTFCLAVLPLLLLEWLVLVLAAPAAVTACLAAPAPASDETRMISAPDVATLLAVKAARSRGCDWLYGHLRRRRTEQVLLRPLCHTQHSILYCGA